jgi:hypothetical protein
MEDSSAYLEFNPEPPPGIGTDYSYLDLIHPTGANRASQSLHAGAGMFDYMFAIAFNGWHAHSSPATYLLKQISDAIGNGIRDLIGSLAYIWPSYMVVTMAFVMALVLALALAIVLFIACRRTSRRCLQSAGGLLQASSRCPPPAGDEQNDGLLMAYELQLQKELELRNELELRKKELRLGEDTTRDLRQQNRQLEHALLAAPVPALAPAAHAAPAAPAAQPLSVSQPDYTLLMFAKNYRAGGTRSRAVLTYLKQNGLDPKLYEQVANNVELDRLIEMASPLHPR